MFFVLLAILGATKTFSKDAFDPKWGEELKKWPVPVAAPQATPPTYTWLKANALTLCGYCHISQRPLLLYYSEISAVVEPSQPLKSKLYYMVRSGRMPKVGRISEEYIDAIYFWILNGAKDD